MNTLEYQVGPPLITRQNFKFQTRKEISHHYFSLALNHLSGSRQTMIFFSQNKSTPNNSNQQPTEQKHIVLRFLFQSSLKSMKFGTFWIKCMLNWEYLQGTQLLKHLSSPITRFSCASDGHWTTATRLQLPAILNI
jgi:hypothetical protein